MFSLIFAAEVTTATIPTEFRGTYAVAEGSCRSGKALTLSEGDADWFGRRDRVVFVERVSVDAVHVFLVKPKQNSAVSELHFEKQGEKGDLLLVIDHLSDAEDIALRGRVTPDKSVVGFFQRCAGSGR